MKTVHRLLSLIAFGLMLYLGVTGSLMQMIDLYTIYRQTPEADQTMMSINEGIWGHRDYAVLSADDYNATPLPSDLDYQHEFATVLQDTHALSLVKKPLFVELRTAEGKIVGQVGYGKDDVQAVDIKTGAARPPTGLATSFPDYSVRQQLKLWHRFWTHHDVPGVYMELISGIILWTLILTGLTMYFRLLKMRRKIKKPQMFWVAGGLWRSLHRTLALCAAVFLIVTAFSGTWLGFESSFHTFSPEAKAVPATLTDSDVQQMATATLADMRRAEPQTPIKVVRVRIYSGMRQGVIVTGGNPTRQIVFDTSTGRIATLQEPGYPTGGFPFGLQVHEIIKHLHSGFMFGQTARWFLLFGGLTLVFLSVSGLWMYADMWRKRMKTGRPNPVWI